MTTRLIKVIALTVLLGLSVPQASALEASFKEQLSLALSEMSQQTTNPFLVIEVAGSNKFIQFYNDQPGIVIDLPSSTLTAEEVERADQFFKSAGVPRQDQIGIDPRTEKEFTVSVWTKRYEPSQIDKVVDVSIGALSEVYQLPANSEFTLIKGWE